jgi:hypothetical protein
VRILAALRAFARGASGRDAGHESAALLRGTLDLSPSNDRPLRARGVDPFLCREYRVAIDLQAAPSDDGDRVCATRREVRVVSWD